MRPRRAILALLVAAGLAPGVVVRAPEPGPYRMQPVTIARLSLPPERDAGSGLTLEAGWTLRSPTGLFGGYSGLVSLDGKGLIALGDGGRLLPIRLEGGAATQAVIDPFTRRGGPEMKSEFDLEAITRAPRTGELWIAAEGANVIQRYDQNLVRLGRARPVAMRDWPYNAGPEAFARLTSGRFLAIREAASFPLGQSHPALLFPADPTARKSPRPLRFDVAVEGLFRPVDAAEMPDGRVAILLRRLDFPFPPRFSSALAIADPRRIRRGETWRADTVIHFPATWPRDNYEGLAVEALPDGAARLWVIADDNDMQHLQKTLLLRLRYDPADR